MTNELVTKDIFVALDTDNDGFISKQHFISQMAEYLSQTEIECTDHALKKLSIVNQYPDMIDYEDFQSFYNDLMEAKTPIENYFDYDKTELDQSDSEIYESQIEEPQDINKSHTTLQGSVINLLETTSGDIQSKKKLRDRQRSRSVYGCQFTTAVAARPTHLSSISSTNSLGRHNKSINGPRHSIDLNNHHQYDMTYDIDDRSVSYCITSDSGCLSSTAAAVAGISMTTEEVERLSKDYRSVADQLDEFKRKFEESNHIYQKQKEMSKYNNERIMMLEEQIRQLEQSQTENLENKTKEFKYMTESLHHKRRKDSEERKYNERKFQEDILHRLSVIESDYNVSRNEYEKIKMEYDKLKKEYDILLKEKEQIRKELKSSEKRNKELDTTMKNFQESFKQQFEEVQRQRDNAENTNKELTDRLYQLETSLSRSPQLSIRGSNNNGTKSCRPLSWTAGGVNTPIGNGTLTPGNISPAAGSILSSSQLSWQSSTNTPSSCTTISQLEQIVHKLTMDNRNLVEKVTHLETLEYFQRTSPYKTNNNNNCDTRTYRCSENNEKSLADEIDQLNYSELKNELAREREVATRLHIYIVSLTNRLIQAGYIEAFRQRGCYRA